MKLLSKTRNGAKVHKVYVTTETAYQRLLDAGVLTEVERQELAAVYHGVNAVVLLKQINDNLECLWRLAERPATLHLTQHVSRSDSSIGDRLSLPNYPVIVVLPSLRGELLSF